MPVRELEDPRLRALFGSGEAKDIGLRPVVQLPRRGLSGWAIAAGAVLAAIMLFQVLESRRSAPPAEPSVGARTVDAPAFAPEPPPLYIPPAPAPSPIVVVPEARTGPVPVLQPQPRPAPLIFTQPAPAPAPMSMQMPAPAPPAAPRASGGSALVIDTTGGAAPAGANAADSSPAASPAFQSGQTGVVRRARASAFANRSTTVAQGTVVPAVLETAFDSTRPGFARAIVSRDVRGFDGTRVLIPRGSRLIGEYRSDVAPGQKRAIISWTRLIRPDGMVIAIDSPAVDPLGRGGVRASVNTHFLERLTGALLQSTIQLGGLLATRSTNAVIVGAPGTAAAGPLTQPGTIAPTLKVPAGTSVSVFVAQDLDFTGEAEGRQP